jgi:hypothetical protein
MNAASVAPIPDAPAAVPFVAPSIHPMPLLGSGKLSEATGVERYRADVVQHGTG